MRSNEIIELIQEQRPLTQESLKELEQILEEYPYFTAAHLLYTVHLNRLKDTRLNAEIRKTACYVNDHTRLFYLMEKDSFPMERISLLEHKDRATDPSLMDRIDDFLLDMNPPESALLPPGPAPKEMITGDYLSYLLSEETSNESVAAPPLQHQSAIDKFLEESEKNPIRIELDDTQAEVSQAPDLDSFEEESFFSETLAKIYIKQKKYHKALEIIQQLYLRNPEKNRYFADQIRFLEILIINDKK